MYQISPEDRLTLILRQHDELREQAARERMAASANPRRPTERSGVPRAGASARHGAWATAAHLAEVLAGRHGVARGGAVR